MRIFPFRQHIHIVATYVDRSKEKDNIEDKKITCMKKKKKKKKWGEIRKQEYKSNKMRF